MSSYELCRSTLEHVGLTERSTCRHTRVVSLNTGACWSNGAVNVSSYELCRSLLEHVGLTEWSMCHHMTVQLDKPVLNRHTVTFSHIYIR